MVNANKSKNNVKNLKTVSINNLSHFYGKNENKKQVLNDVNLNIDKGELVLLKGPSGCGKTTLLTLIGALRTCQSGDLTVLNNQLNGASRKTRQILRRSIGMIFQGHNLLRCLTAEQNVQMGVFTSYCFWFKFPRRFHSSNSKHLSHMILKHIS